MSLPWQKNGKGVCSIEVDVFYPVVFLKVPLFKKATELLDPHYQTEVEKLKLDHFLFKLSHWRCPIMISKDKRFRPYTSVAHYAELLDILEDI